MVSLVSKQLAPAASRPKHKGSTQFVAVHFDAARSKDLLEKVFLLYEDIVLGLGLLGYRQLLYVSC